MLLADGTFDFPTLSVQAGLVTATPVQAITSLILNSATLGLLNTGTLGEGVSWTDITDFVNNFTVNRPATREQGPLWNFQAGTLTMSLDNSDGRFDPDNLSGPYVIGGVSQIDVAVPIRIIAYFDDIAYPLYSGYADGWAPDDVTYSGDYATLTLTATDAFESLSNVTLAALGSAEGTGADTGARVADILSRAGWYTSAEYSQIDTGNSVLQGTVLGQDALSELQTAVNSEVGRLYVNESGAVVFNNRHSLLTDPNSVTVQAVFGDQAGTVQTAGTELTCATISRVLDNTTLGNDIQATRNGGTMQEVKDTTSIGKYLFPRTYSNTSLMLQTDADALNWAEWVLYISKNSENRFNTITVDPLADTENLWPQVLGRVFGDRIQGWMTPAGLSSRITRDNFITGIQHTCDAINGTWSTVWTLQDASKYSSFLVLNDATRGQLNNNALTY